ncbi:hypothetical protein [Streptomyces lavendulocolor]|uniref:hypothetical protein n=1 Tax=Streptomyces lavendulocolor TaxID=67316 RepID=UPI003C2FD447
MSEIRTAAERLEKVRETLEGFQGARAGSRAARRLALSRGQNLLLGAALHAAARLDKGLEPTELEERLLRMLRAGADDDAEVASWGRLFSEQRSARGGVGVFPAAINQLDVNTGYGMQELRADLAEVTAEIVAQPNVAIVDVTQTTPDEEKDTPEFLQALAEYGSGITVLTTPEERQGRTPVPALPLRVHLAPYNFYCERRSNEAGHDEIYWALSGGTDSMGKHSGKTPEFGSTLTGHTRWFTPPHDFVFVDGLVHGYVALNIECWEADDSSGGFYNKMREVLATMAERLAEGAQSQTYDPPSGGGDNGESWAALLAVVLGLINALLGWLTNDDDLVAERTLGFSRDALKHYFTPAGREAEWMFDGGSGGKHRLRLRGTVSEINLGAYHRSKGTADTWSAPPSTPSANNLIAVAATYNGGFIPFYVTATAELWHGSSRVPGVRTALAPGVAMRGGKLYCMYVGLDNHLYWCALSNGTWSTPVGIGGWATWHSPALYSNMSRLYCALTGLDGKIWISSFNESNASWNAAFPIDHHTSNAPALISHKNALHCAYHTKEGFLYLTSSENGTDWQRSISASSDRTYNAPALGEYRGRLLVAWRDISNNVKVSERGSNGWGPHTVLHSGGYGDPCIAFDGTLSTSNIAAYYLK